MMNFSQLISEVLKYIEKIPMLKIGFIIVGGIIAYILIKTFGEIWIMKMMKRKYRKRDKEALQKRTQTLHQTLTTALKIVIIFTGFLLILDEIGINLAPFVAGAGIVGLAVGFGSQSLVKDFVSGTFILVEDQFRKGDKVKIGGFEGKVENFTLRRTLLRDDKDNLHYIPNNQINFVSNLTKGKEGKTKEEKNLQAKK
ncbi:MAG: mechanosensitive ion channel [Candidatus Pacebacteria bacterium]|jgi:small conductance mechanosensitive channel|nr:mechanosensitive ion channel [Candidatus Paceibacterota bacterium]